MCFRDLIARLPDLPVKEFRSYFPLPIQETEAASSDALKRVGFNNSPLQVGLLEAVIYVCAYSDRYVQPLVYPESHPWTCH